MLVKRFDDAAGNVLEPTSMAGRPRAAAMVLIEGRTT
jgi:hypothetical protein